MTRVSVSDARVVTRRKLAADRRRRNFFGVLQYVIFRWSKVRLLAGRARGPAA